MLGNIKFCAVMINVSTKHSVSTMPVSLNFMASSPNSDGRWILMAGYYWQTVRHRQQQKFNDFAHAKGLEAIWQSSSFSNTDSKSI